MEKLKETNIDAEALILHDEEEKLFGLKVNESDYGVNALEENSQGINFEYWTKSLTNESSSIDYRNPFTDLNGTVKPQEKPEGNIFTNALDWIKENPGKTIIAGLLLGGASYLLVKYFQEKKNNKENKTSRLRRKRKKETESEVQDEIKEQDSESNFTVKEIAIGGLAAAGGALAGTVLNEYAIAKRQKIKQ